jgi:hypothetical protein
MARIEEFLHTNASNVTGTACDENSHRKGKSDPMIKQVSPKGNGKRESPLESCLMELEKRASGEQKAFVWVRLKGL